MLTIRNFEGTDAEYEAVVLIANALWPDELEDIAEIKHRDKTRDPQYLFRRILGEEGGRIIASGAYGESSWSHVPGKYFIYVSVHPDHQRRGVGSALYDHITDALAGCDPAPIMYASDTREDKPGYVRFLTKRGFKQVMRDAVSRADPREFDRSTFERTEADVREMGIEIRSFKELEPVDPDLRRRMWELDWALMQDVPMPDPATKQPFDQFEKMLGSPGFFPDAWFIAVDGGEYVGMSCLWLSLADSKKLYTGLTGVVRSHRRKGVATAMKVRALQFAKDYGASVVETDNEENNPMYGLNLRLGFRPTPAWLCFKEFLKEAGGGGPTA